MSPSEGLSVDSVDVGYRGAPVLRGVSFDVAPGELVALVGPNGSGKTTLLRAICGLEPVERGTIRWNGTDLAGVPTHRRGIGLLFQEPALFPGRTVAENVAYGLDVARWERPAVDARVAELLDRVGLSGLAGRSATTLSGGERQRTALARTLAPRPRIVLLDEPFAAVDPEFRSVMREEFRAVLRREGVGGLHVTHDPEEALAVGDRLGVLRDGRLVRLAPPAEALQGPGDRETARFLGYQLVGSPEGVVGVLPRELREVADGSPGWPGRIDAVRLGIGEWRIAVRLESGEVIEWRRPSEAAPVVVGATVRLAPVRSVRWSDAPGADAPTTPPPKG